MTQSLLAKLDELQAKVSNLSKELEQSRADSKSAKNQIEKLRHENEQLHKKVNDAQAQINQMLNQWFPEIELNSEA